MTITEVISALEVIKAEHGDLAVTFFDMHDEGSWSGGVAISEITAVKDNGGMTRKSCGMEVLIK